MLPMAEPVAVTLRPHPIVDARVSHREARLPTPAGLTIVSMKP